MDYPGPHEHLYNSQQMAMTPMYSYGQPQEYGDSSAQYPPSNYYQLNHAELQYDDAARNNVHASTFGKSSSSKKPNKSQSRKNDITQSQQNSIAKMMSQAQSSSSAQRLRMQYPARPKRPNVMMELPQEEPIPPRSTSIALPASLRLSESLWKRLEMREFLARFGSTVLKLPRWILFKFDDPRFVEEEDEKDNAEYCVKSEVPDRSDAIHHQGNVVKEQWPQISAKVWRILLTAICKTMRVVAAQGKDREQIDLIKEALKELANQSNDMIVVWHKMQELLQLFAQDQEGETVKHESSLDLQKVMSIDDKIEIINAMFQELMGTWAIRDELERGSNDMREKSIKYHEEKENITKSSSSAKTELEEEKTNATPFNWTQEQDREWQSKMTQITKDREARLSRLELGYTTDLLHLSVRNPALAMDHTGNVYHRLLDLDRTSQRKKTVGGGCRWGRWILVSVPDGSGNSGQMDQASLTNQGGDHEAKIGHLQLWCINTAEQVEDLIKYLTLKRKQLQDISIMDQYEADLATFQFVVNEMDRCLADGVPYDDDSFGKPLRERLQVELDSRYRQAGLDIYGTEKEWEEMIKRLNLAGRWLSMFPEPESTDVQAGIPTAANDAEADTEEGLPLADHLDDESSVGESNEQSKSPVEEDSEPDSKAIKEHMVTRLRSRRRLDDRLPEQETDNDSNTDEEQTVKVTRSGRLTRSGVR